MTNKFLIGAGMAACAVMAVAASDPTLMTIGNIEVPKSEFEYLYHKNTQQQVSPQPLEEYVDMFEIYKMKVADALEEGIDTTAQFRKEISQYRDELAEPYLADSAYLRQLAKEQYERSKFEYEANHIMLRKTPTREGNLAAIAKLDSIRNLIINGADFATLAGQYSVDGLSKNNGGSMGYVLATKLPYEFEQVMINTPEGEISEVFESPMCYHIIKGGKKRPARGFVKAAHILKLVDANATVDVQMAAKAEIDSIYNIVAANPTMFEDLARAYSDDKGSAQKGGMLPVFGTGMMVKEFEDVAFDLKPGEISEPFRSQFGWHIISKVEAIPVAPYEKAEQNLINRIQNVQDPRHFDVISNRVKKLGKKYKLKVNNKIVDDMCRYALANGIDSMFYDNFSTPALSATQVYCYKDGAKNVSDLLEYVRTRCNTASPAADVEIRHALDAMANDDLVKSEKATLEKECPEYANLLHEYVDGSLLYEISLRKVWDKASKDTEGLQKFFERNRGDFKWDEPRVKGIIVLAVNDSIANAARKRMEELPKDSIIPTIRKEFKRDVQIDKVLVRRGDNQLVDYIMFNPADGQPPLNTRYPSYFLFNPVIINAPEEVEDVKGLVTSAYQDELEQEWVKELKKKYAVKVNDKVLKKVK